MMLFGVLVCSSCKVNKVGDGGNGSVIKLIIDKYLRNGCYVLYEGD